MIPQPVALDCASRTTLTTTKSQRQHQRPSTLPKNKIASKKKKNKILKKKEQNPNVNANALAHRAYKETRLSALLRNTTKCPFKKHNKVPF